MSGKKARILTFVSIVIFLFPFRSSAQELPLLLEIPPSPSINGHGGAGTAFLSEDAFGFFYNPAHLGYIGNTINFSLHVYPQKMSLFSADKPEYKANQVPKSDKPEPGRACLEITNYKSQITSKLQIPMTKTTTILTELLLPVMYSG